MNCVICGNKVEEANHIAITNEGEQGNMCDDCYKNEKPISQEVVDDDMRAP